MKIPRSKAGRHMHVRAHPPECTHVHTETRREKAIKRRLETFKRLHLTMLDLNEKLVLLNTRSHTCMGKVMHI